MKCKVDGCYARPFNKNLCRNHYYSWDAQLPTTQPRQQKERNLRATPAAFRAQSSLPYNGPCRCEQPNPQRIPMFNCYQCANCGMPLERINS